MPYRPLLLALFLGLTLAGCADTLDGGGYRSGTGAWDDGPYDWSDNGRCDDPNYNISGFGEAWPGTDEFDCRRYGGGLRGGYVGGYYGWYGPDRSYEWQRRREIEIRRRLEEQRRDRERAERHDRDHDRDRDRDRDRDHQRNWNPRPGGERGHRDGDDAARRQQWEQRRQQREQARPNDGWRGDGEGRRGQDRPAQPAVPSAAPDVQQHPNLPPPPPAANQQRHPRLDMGERRQEP